MTTRMGSPSMFMSLAVLLSSMAACGGGEPSQAGGESDVQPDPRGRLVIVGGALQAENTEVYQAILEGRSGDGPICVFPTASAEPQESMASAISRIDAVGGPGTAAGIFLTVDNPEAAALPATVSQIEGCSGFYFVGGQQGRIVEVFRPYGGDSPAYGALMERYHAGAVVSGSSAGAAIMNDPMIGGGNSLGALAEGVRSGEDGEGVILEKGMGFLQNTLVDQHFLARGRWGRLLVAVLETESYPFGAGIDENTALVVEGPSAWVVGASGVVFFDTRDVVREEQGLGASGVSVTLLGAGDRVDLGTGAFEPGVGKEPWMGPLGTENPFDSDLFRRWGLLAFFAESGISSESAFTFQGDDFRLEFTKGPGFRALAGDGPGVEGAPAGLSVGPLELAFSTVGSG
jgi:cyanophycinase